MSHKKYSALSILLLIIVCLVLIGVHLNSTDSFRKVLAGFCKAGGRYTQAITLYKKIIRKDRVKRRLTDNDFADVKFNLGRSYAEIGLTDLAIESYATGSARSTDIEMDDYYGGTPEDDRLIAIGFLEAGNWDDAIDGFLRIKQLYPGSADTGPYIAIAEALKKRDFDGNQKDLLFAVGDSYIEKRLFDDAKSFFTKRLLDYGIPPLEVLRYLHETYSLTPQIKEAVWGGYIYVVLEDFEKITPRLKRWVTQARPRINSHFISDEVAYKGSRSEFLDISYSRKDYDYWIKDVDIPLSADFPLGLRIFIKSREPFRSHLKQGIVYAEKSGTAVIERSDAKEDIGGGWEMQIIEDLYTKAKAIGDKIGCVGCAIRMDKVIVDTTGTSNTFYIDNIELFLAR